MEIRIHLKGWHLAVVAAVGLGAAAVHAASPTPAVIRACYQEESGRLRLLVREHQSCRGEERPISWNQAGIAGPPGAVGPAGPPGTFGGVLASPSGAYTLAVADDGIRLDGPAGSLHFEAGGLTVHTAAVDARVDRDVALAVGGNSTTSVAGNAAVTVGADIAFGVGRDLKTSVGRDVTLAAGNATTRVAGNATETVDGSAQVRVGTDLAVLVGRNASVRAGSDVAVAAGAALSANSGGPTSVQAGGNLLLEATGLTHLEGALVCLKGCGSSVARVGDMVTVSGASGQISTGSFTVAAGN